MSPKVDSGIRIVGGFVLFLAAIFLLLFLANLRSHFYYNGPNFGFLFWIFFDCVLTGVGLLKLRRWAVLLLFLPGILTVTIFTYSWVKGARVLMPWALLNYSFVAALLGIPALLLRHWRELRW